MKKIFSLMMVAFAAAATIFTACEEDNEATIRLEQSGTHSEVIGSKDVSMEDALFNDLLTFNDSVLLASTYQSETTRAGGWWRRMLHIVCADILGARDGAIVGALFGGEGAAIGGVVGAAIYSWNAGAKEYGNEMPNAQSDGGNVSVSQLLVERAYARTRNNESLLDEIPTIQLNFPTDYAVTAAQVGKAHNAILDLCKGNQEEAATIEEVTGMLTESQIAVIHSPKFVAMVNKAVSTGDFTVDVSDAKGNYIINLFMSVAEDATASQQDLHYIINRYVSIIEANGSLSEEDKIQVYNALSVAAYSCDYWEKYSSK